AGAQRIQSRTAQTRGVLEVCFGGVKSKRMPMAHALVHEVHADRFAVYPDAGEAGLRYCFDCHHDAPAAYAYSAFVCSFKGHWPVLSMKSSKRPGGMERSPASQRCHARSDTRTICAASVWVRPATMRASRMVATGGLCCF